MRVEDVLSRVAEQNADGCGVIFGDVRRSWAEIEDRVARMAGALRALGIEEGANIAVLSPNSDRYMELFFAVPRAGATIVPLNIRWSTLEISQALTGCEAQILFISSDLLPMAAELRQTIPSLTHIFGLDAEDESVDGLYDGLLQAAEPLREDVAGPDLYAIFYTGGTTGAPKGVMLSHANIIASALTWIAVLNHRPDARQLQVGGFFHLSGLAHLFYVTMIGATNILIPKFEPELAMQALSTHKATHTLLLPTMINMMLRHPNFGDYDLSSVETCIYGGSPMSGAALAAFMEKLPSWQFIQAYAMTESASLGSFLEWQHHVANGQPHPKISTAGRAAPGLSLRILGEDGATLPPGEVGEIALTSLTVAQGYYRNPEATAETFRNGWLMTGDLGKLDEEGFLSVVDRAKDMIVTGGENVFSVEVEQAVMKIPGVTDCAVIGVPDELWGEAVCAVVVTAPGAELTGETVKSHCAELIARYKCPKRVEFRTEPLPITATGKVRKDVLRTPFWAGRSKRVG